MKRIAEHLDCLLDDVEHGLGGEGGAAVPEVDAQARNSRHHIGCMVIIRES